MHVPHSRRIESDMPRPRNFSREMVLEKALPVFWKQGFADTTLQDLESATGVNKSGLYAEFQDKNDLYLATLRHYIETSGIKDTLTAIPLGWDNVERYLEVALGCVGDQKGCFSTNSMRELAILPAEAQGIVANSLKPLRQHLIKNIEAERPRMPAESLAEIVMTFFAGTSLEQNLASSRTAGSRKIKFFIRIMRTL
jgi:TetR/AcrR family transcriptional regulator, copper-responsive repressor